MSILQVVVYSLPVIVGLFVLAPYLRSATSIATLVGIALIVYLMQGALDGVTFKLGSKNATLDFGIDAAEFARVKATVEQLNRNLFGEDSDGSGARLTSLASLLRDAGSVEAKIAEVKGVLAMLRNDSGAIDALLESQAQRLERVSRTAVGHALDLATGEGFWQQLSPRLREAGLISEVDPALMSEVETAKARAQEKLRIESGVLERLEQIRAEGWVHLARAISKDFDERLPLRLGALLALIAGGLALRLAYHIALRRLQIPPLVDETSLSSWRSLLPFRCPRRRPSCFRKGATSAGDDDEDEDDLASAIFRSSSPEIVLAADVRESVSDMALAALHAAGHAHMPAAMSSTRCPSASSGTTWTALFAAMSSPLVPSASSASRGKGLTGAARAFRGRCKIIFSAYRTWAARRGTLGERRRRRALALPNAVFFGPPGTGKSLTARRLATACGLDYAILSGGNVLGLREEAVPELRRIFDWARRAPHGLVLFIDEAEAFLATRGAAGSGGSHYVQAAVSFFLAQTTGSSSKLLVILATNRVHDLDEAVLSRMPYQIEFGRPSAEMVERLLEDRLRGLDADDHDHSEGSCDDGVAADRAPKLAERLKMALEEVGGSEGLERLSFSGRDLQSLVEAFDRRGSLEAARTATKRAACRSAGANGVEAPGRSGSPPHRWSQTSLLQGPRCRTTEAEDRAWLRRFLSQRCADKEHASATGAAATGATASTAGAGARR